MSTKSYSELIHIPDFLGRYNYLKLNGVAFLSTFGENRYLCQQFYSSYDWRKFRREIIIRDHGCDLGIDGRTLNEVGIIHHINPITIDDIINRSRRLFDPENVILVQRSTHNAIHYGGQDLLFLDPIERKEHDTSPWRF